MFMLWGIVGETGYLVERECCCDEQDGVGSVTGGFGYLKFTYYKVFAQERDVGQRAGYGQVGERASEVGCISQHRACRGSGPGVGGYHFADHSHGVNVAFGW